jgi:integrase
MISKYPSYKGITMQEIKAKLPSVVRKDIDNFLEYCAITGSASTIQKHSYKIIQICDVMQKDTSKIVLQDVRKFLVILNESKRGADTQNDIKKTLKRFLKWKYKDWNRRFEELKDVRQKKKPKSDRLKKEDMLSLEEIETLIRDAQDLKMKALIILMFESAGRPEEIYNLKWKSINFEDKELTLSSAKTGDVRTVPIDQSVNRLKLYKQEYPFPKVKAEDYVFPHPQDRKRPVTTQVMDYYLKKVIGKSIKKKVNPYLFRHTRLNSVRKKLSPDVYEKFSGHSMAVALEHYSHIDNEDVREEMNRKIYDIEELTQSQKEEFKEMKKEVTELKEYLQPFINDRKKMLEEIKKSYSKHPELVQGFENELKKVSNISKP